MSCLGSERLNFRNKSLASRVWEISMSSGMRTCNGTQDQTNLAMCCNHLWSQTRHGRSQGSGPSCVVSPCRIPPSIRPMRLRDLVSYIQQEFPWLQELTSVDTRTQQPWPQVAVGMESKAQLACRRVSGGGRSAPDLLIQYSAVTEGIGIIHFGQGSGGW